MERKRNATNFVRVVSMMEFDRWTEASSIGLVCSDKGESPDIGRTVECPTSSSPSYSTLVSDNKISLWVPYPSLVSLMDRGWAAREERQEGRIEGEVKRKVKGIERLRLEQVPLSGNGLAARCHDQTRVCTASTVLAEEQPGKLNFGWNGRRRGEVEKKVYEGVDEGEGMLRAQVSRKGGEAEEDGGARRPFPRDSPI